MRQSKTLLKTLTYNMSVVMKPTAIYVIITMILFPILVSYLYHLIMRNYQFNDVYWNYLIALRIFFFLLQFTLSLLAITLIHYTFNDKSIIYSIISTNSRVIPILGKLGSAIASQLIVNFLFFLLFLVYGLIFFKILIPLDIFVQILFLLLFLIIFYSSLSFFGVIFVNYFNKNIIYSLFIPVIFLFIIPQFVFTGISNGIFPEMIYILTYQYYISSITNYLLPSPFHIVVSYELTVISTLILVFSIAFFLIGGLIITKKTEYR